ncbi:S8 family serine peptidase [Mycetocola saprophilus]|uniref:S8 family serine peptidase n=1 Tax=Mycetocola saprophilus TaxID=76636 RepID=UPI003BF23286
MALLRGIAAATLAALIIGGGVVSAGSAWSEARDPTPGNADRLVRAQGAVPQTPIQTPTQTRAGLAPATAPVSVFVQLRGPGAFAAVSRARGGDSTRTALESREGIRGQARDIAASIGAEPLYVTTDALPGIALTAAPDQIAALRARPEVSKVTPIVTKFAPSARQGAPTEPPRGTGPGGGGATTYNAGSVRDTQTAAAWRKTGRTGEGITIAVVDTGIDYTHADFGGPGTAAAFAEASTAETPPAGLFDPRKFGGGYDFAGDSYDPNPNSPTFQPTPTPDANPLDCAAAGHGTHVAGTAAGFGIRADGSAQDSNTDFSALSDAEVATQLPGPGAAPRAKLLAYRVFGCTGSTNLVLQALDRVLDPNGDGNFDDRADIVNLSLGSDYAPVDDPENEMIASLARFGVLPVIAAGNAGDLYDVGGSPGNAPAALTVANSIGSTLALDSAEVLAPTPGEITGQYGADFDYTGADPATLTGTVVAGPEGENSEGCEPFSAEDAARVSGNWVWLRWDDNADTRACGSAVRFDAAARAGARGVVLDSTLNAFDAGIAGTAAIPGIQLTRASSEALRPSIGTLQVRLSPEGRGVARGESGTSGALAENSSRGPHGSIGVVKPDVAAPGTQIASAGAGSGTGVRVATGTSMSTPLVAGIAALAAEGTALRGSELKAAVVNAADGDLTLGDTPFAPGRVGTGAVNALAAVTTKTRVTDAESPEGISIEFGVREIGAVAFSETREIAVTNTSNASRTYALSYQAATAVPGAALDLPDSVVVAAGETARVPLTLRIDDPTALRKKRDATRAGSTWGVAWQELSEVSGRVRVTTPGQPPVRVAVHAAPKPVAEISAAITPVSPGDGDTSLTLGGRELNQGTLGTDGYTSLLAPFQLGAESPRRTDLSGEENGPEIPSVRALDLRAVGAATTVPALRAAGGDLTAGNLTFGIATWGNWAALTPSSAFEVLIDSTGSGTDDYLLDVAFASQVSLDLPLIRLTRLGATPADNVVIDSQPVNFVDGAVDTNTFDSNVLVMPVSLASLGIAPDRVGGLKYRVRTASALWAPGGTPEPVDQTESIGFDPNNPDLWVDGAAGEQGPLFPALTDTELRVHRAPEASWDSRVLLLNLHNSTGNLAAGGDGGARTQILDVPVLGVSPAPSPSPDPTETTQPTGPDQETRPSADAARGDGQQGTGPLGATGAGGWLPVMLAALLLALLGAGTTILRRRTR